MDTRTKVVVAVVGVLLSATVLVVAWQLDDGMQLVQISVLEQSEEEGRLVIQMEERLGEDFIVLCPEERFQEAFAELRSFVNVSTEPLHFPGGPMVLSFADFEVPESLESARSVLQNFLQRFSPGRIVLVSHSECLYYESLAIFGNNLYGVRERQIRDLEKARTAILQWLPNTEVELYYADKDGERLTFTRLSQ